MCIANKAMKKWVAGEHGRGDLCHCLRETRGIDATAKHAANDMSQIGIQIGWVGILQYAGDCCDATVYSCIITISNCLKIYQPIITTPLELLLLFVIL